MRPIFPKTTLVSVIGTALIAVCTVVMLLWTIHDPSGLGDEGINPNTGMPWKPTTFDLVFGYACFSFLVVIAVYCAAREFIEYCGIRRPRDATANIRRNNVKRRICYAALFMVSLGWVQSCLYPISISCFFPGESNNQLQIDSGYGVVEIPLFKVFADRLEYHRPLQVQHFSAEPDNPMRRRHTFQFILTVDPQSPSYRVLVIPYWCLALCMLLFLALLPRKQSGTASSGFPMIIDRFA